MTTERFWILLGKKKSGEATGAELEELDSYLSANHLSGYSYEVIDKMWESSLQTTLESSPNTGTWNNILETIHNRRRLGILYVLNKWKWMAAACFLIVIGAGLMIYLQEPSGVTPRTPVTKHSPNRYSTSPGSKSKLLLPDGTQVWLNGNSELSFTGEGFGTRMREIYLSGEAFFDVVKNEKVPLIIHAGPVNIMVKGTAFNVKAYSNEKTIETSLVRGLIEITTIRDPDRKIILKPNEKIIIPSDTSLMEIKKSEATQNAMQSVYAISSLHTDKSNLLPETVWMENKLIFNDEPFGELSPKMEAWFNVKIRINDEQIRQKRFSGVIEKETLKEMLSALQLSFPFNYELNVNELTIFKKK